MYQIFKSIVLYILLRMFYIIFNKKFNKKILEQLIILLIFYALISNDIIKYLISGLSFIFIDKIINFLEKNNKTIYKLLNKEEKIIIKDGKIDFNEFSKLDCSIDFLILNLKKLGIESISNINFATIDNNFNLNIYD